MTIISIKTLSITYSGHQKAVRRKWTSFSGIISLLKYHGNGAKTFMKLYFYFDLVRSLVNVSRHAARWEAGVAAAPSIRAGLL